MPKIMPTDINDEVKAILKSTQKDSHYGHSYLTAYQILEKLPSQIRDQLIKERGMPGQGSVNNFTAASVVSDAAEMLPGIEIVFLDSSFLKIMLRDGTNLVVPGNANIGLYRLK